MGKQRHLAYLESIRGRYHRSGKLKRTLILDEFCAICNYNRKYAIRLLSRLTKPATKRTGPKPQYDSEEFKKPLITIWLAAGRPCSKKLKIILSQWLGYYDSTYGILNVEIKKKLLKISSATIDRVISKTKMTNRKGLSGTKPGTLLKNQIKIQEDCWDVTKPGYIEADTVALCGNSLIGGFIWCITMTDIHTTWTEIRGAWNKRSLGILNQIKDIEACLPFKLLGFDCDNGTEFLNHHLIKYLSKREEAVQFTRSRPYRKNDNAHVEQKNWTHVRQLFGYDRFSDPALVHLVNDLLKNEWSQYKNHFLPSTKLISKEKINSKYKRVYDTPKTPYHRLMELPEMDRQAKLLLMEKHSKLNPFMLRRRIDEKLEKIMRLVKVTSNMSQRSTG